MTQDNRPQRANPRDLEAQPLEKPSGGKLQGMMGGNGLMYFIMVVVLLVVVYLSPNFVGVNPAQYKKDIASLNGSISAAQSDIKAVKDSNDKAISSIPTSVSKAVTDATTALTDSIKQLQTSVNDLKGQITSSGATASSAFTKVNALNDQLAKISSDLTALQTTVGKIDLTKDQADIAALKTQLDILTGQVKTLVTTTTPTTTPTTAPTNGVTVALVGNAFTGSNLLNFAAMAINTTSNQTFSFTLTNSTGKSVTNVQLAIGLELLDGSGNIILAGLPSDSTITITSVNLATIWSEQSTGYKYLRGFTNTATSSVFGGIGIITQGTGTTSYSITVAITSGGTNPISAFNIYPIVKVVSYQ